MLTLTPAATAAVTTLLENPGLPENAGLRLHQATDPTGRPAIGIDIVEAPEPDDEHVPTGDSELFVAPEVSEALSDLVLDAEIDQQNVAFTLRPQSVNGRPPVEPE